MLNDRKIEHLLRCARNCPCWSSLCKLSTRDEIHLKRSQGRRTAYITYREVIWSPNIESAGSLARVMSSVELEVRAVSDLLNTFSNLIKSTLRFWIRCGAVCCPEGMAMSRNAQWFDFRALGSWLSSLSPLCTKPIEKKRLEWGWSFYNLEVLWNHEERSASRSIKVNVYSNVL